EILGQFARGGVASADDHRLEREAGQQEALEPVPPADGFARAHARQLSTSAANAAPPRIGSATGMLSRSRSAAINASASSALRLEVLRLTPPQRIDGLVRLPRRIVRSTTSST